MARTVDPARYERRRLAIVEAALTCFADHGFERTGTAAICRAAGIGSGTFFHYFPTKLDVLLAVLRLGTAGTEEWFAAQSQAGRADAAAVVDEFVTHTVAECADPRMPGFVKAVGALVAEPDVAAALARDTAATHGGLLPWIKAAQAAGDVRVDVSADRLCTWVLVVLDGFLSRLAEDEAFEARAEQGMLVDAVRRLLVP